MELKLRLYNKIGVFENKAIILKKKNEKLKVIVNGKLVKVN